MHMKSIPGSHRVINMSSIIKSTFLISNSGENHPLTLLRGSQGAQFGVSQRNVTGYQFHTSLFPYTMAYYLV